MLVASAESALAPADVQQFAVSMDELMQWVERYGVIPLDANPARRRAQIADTVRGYDAALSDLPADILLNAVRETIRTHRYRTLPMPGDIRAFAETELRERQTRLLRLKTAAMIAEREAKARAEYSAPRERTPEEIAAAAAMAEQVRAMPVVPQTVPAQAADLKPDPVSDHREAVRRVMAETQAFKRVPKPWERAASGTASTEGGANG
ncbi:hypothetical protein ABNQ39_00045 (plasmid) [Azospirillum sp. A26]|uniref:hypothetical protein n=1 Tax=Azospirillum sp. A26 TaxID=3160607 RepID=UPI00366E3C54